jgi:tetratricopeptide (TPR) repeat protein
LNLAGDGLGIANVRNNLGGLEFQDPEGDKVEAARHFQAALELLRGAGDARGIAAALTNLGAIAFEAGRVDEASERYREALRFQRELCDVSGIASSLFNLGEAVELKGQQGDGQRNEVQTRHAYRLLAAAEHLFDEVGSPYKSFAREFCARTAADLGYTSAALDALQRNLRAKSLDDLLTWALPENS